jgi:hypothetical protein
VNQYYLVLASAKKRLIKHTNNMYAQYAYCKIENKVISGTDNIGSSGINVLNSEHQQTAMCIRNQPFSKVQSNSNVHVFIS